MCGSSDNCVEIVRPEHDDDNLIGKQITINNTSPTDQKYEIIKDLKNVMDILEGLRLDEDGNFRLFDELLEVKGVKLKSLNLKNCKVS